MNKQNHVNRCLTRRGNTCGCFEDDIKPRRLIGQRVLTEEQAKDLQEQGFYVRFLAWHENGTNVYEITVDREQ